MFIRGNVYVALWKQLCWTDLLMFKYDYIFNWKVWTPISLQNSLDVFVVVCWEKDRTVLNINNIKRGAESDLHQHQETKYNLCLTIICLSSQARRIIN